MSEEKEDAIVLLNRACTLYCDWYSGKTEVAMTGSQLAYELVSYCRLVISALKDERDSSRAEFYAEFHAELMDRIRKEGDPPCECCELGLYLEGYWSMRCECGNPGDGERASDWCGRVNLLMELAKNYAPAKLGKGDQ